MGWGKTIPDIVLVGGANGSGKTTLLEMLFGIVRFVVDASSPDDLNGDALAMLPRGAELVDISLAVGSQPHDLTISSRTLVEVPLRRGVWSIWTPVPDETENPEFPSREAVQSERQVLTRMCRQPEGPKLLYFPTDRAVTFPATRFKGPGNRSGDLEAAYRYRAPKEWMQSIEAILYDARWRDLNAKERGKAGAGHFAAYEATMQRFFGETKRFAWDEEGVLHVQTRDGTLHPLDELSSGEKQILLFGAELHRRWTPGSLVLLDEPELHLHDAWLSTLWSFLRELQRERGGQVIIATQSNYLFGLGEPGSRVILGRAP